MKFASQSCELSSSGSLVTLKFTISCLHTPFSATFPNALPLPIYFATVVVAALISSACDKPQNSVS